MAVLNCSCHGEPSYWVKDARYRGGGHWQCAVRRRAKSRAYYEANRARKLQRLRDRYDEDPGFRIGKLLHDAARKRAATLKRRREQHGPLPD